MTDKRRPTPEEIQSEFESFFKDKFGDNVKVYAGNGFEGQPEGQLSEEPTEPAKSEEIKANIESFSLKPRDIKDHLDQYVIGQDDAKKALAIAVCDHYNHVRRILSNEGDEQAEYSKQNVLILGPTGVGKSYLIKQIAKMIGVPFVKADATRFSETGYMGANVDDLIKDLVKQADDDLDLAQFGIVYLDEADKLAAAGERVGRDVSGRGVQFGLLKIMEESEVDLRGGNDMASQMQAFMDFQRNGKVSKKVLNTRFVLFIVSGAFTGLDEIINKRIDANKIGFGTEKYSANDQKNVLALANTQDLIEFGFEPEFIGRLPIRVACHPLATDDLYEILKNSKGSIIRQYEEAFAAYNIKAEFTDEALYRVAEIAYDQKTGARALMTVCEAILRNFKFELPSTLIKTLEISAEIINNPEQELKKLLASAPEIEHVTIRKGVTAFSEQFFKDHGMVFHFTDDAIEYIATVSEKIPDAVIEYCAAAFQGFEHGLKLIQQNTGKSQFEISKKTLEDPKASLEVWIKESYI